MSFRNIENTSAKINKLELYTTTWMNLTKTILNENLGTEEDILYNSI